MNDHCGYHFPLHFSPEFHDFHHLKLVPGTSSHSNCSTQHIQITKISQLNRIKTRFLSSKQVSHQLWLVWHLGLDPWHRRQIWQIHHTQVTFCICNVMPCNFHDQWTFIFSPPFTFQIEAFPVDVGQGRAGTLSWRFFQARVKMEKKYIRIWLIYNYPDECFKQEWKLE